MSALRAMVIWDNVVIIRQLVGGDNCQIIASLEGLPAVALISEHPLPFGPNILPLKFSSKNMVCLFLTPLFISLLVCLFTLHIFRFVETC